MKNIFRICLVAALICPVALSAQIKNLFVETYYISDATDASDSTNYYVDPAYLMPVLPAGSKTYRVYIELEPGSRLKKIYGDVNHALKISSTQNFYNNIDRPAAYFGYLINKSWFATNPTIALDSWLTLGLGERTKSGTLKTKDTDGSLISGTGLLSNSDASAGIPITAADGFTPTGITTPVWIDHGFRNSVSAGIDTTVFGSVNNGSEFISNDAYLQQNTGMVGAPADSNKVLIAQLTTQGEISLELNVVLIEPTASGTIDVKYVANLAPGEGNSDTLKISPYLKYPTVCGCTDPNYLEYSTSFACFNSDSCKNRIVFGCMDPAACNYNPDANYNISSLCCYPGYCQDRDIAVVCPVLTMKRFHLYPNPVKDLAALEIVSAVEEETTYGIYDTFGRLMFEEDIRIPQGTSTVKIDASGLSKGVYMFRLHGGNSESKMFLKD